nr:formylglycine-generating enzyme family protein [Elainella sp. Prado103]
KNITIPIDPAEIPPSIISIDNAPESNPPAQLSSDTTLQLAADGIRGVSQPPVAETINLHDQDNLLPTLLHEATQPATKQSDLPQPATPSKHRTSRKQAAIEPTDTEPIDPRLALATRSFSFEVVKLDSQGQEQSRETKRAKCLRENLGNNIHLEMVAISGGEFVMGSNRVGRRESPPHRVTVQPFYLGRYVITQEQWQAVAQLPTVNRELNPRPAHFQHHGKKRPVECVYWHDCIEFCDRLSQKTGRKYRLPSEAEWEYACRAGTDTLYHFGDVITGAFVNYKELNNQGSAQNYSHQTIRVDSCKFANDFGLVGMHGNVQEWCYDPWHETYEQAPTDGSAWLRDLEDRNESWRITRGGSWQSEAKYCNSFYRLRWLASTKRDKFIGFRIALSGDTESR